MNTTAARSPLAIEPGSLRAWVVAFRPKTLAAGAVPVLVGTAIAFGAGHGHLLAAFLALAGALAIQIGTNLANDYYDYVKGADTEERLGPLRAAQAGLLPPDSVRRGAFYAFGLAALFGIYLVWLGGWPIVVIGLTSLVCGYAYTGGPFPLGYLGLGDPLVLLYFGFIAVGGTYYLQTGGLHAAAIWSGLAVGALGTALIVVNNVRDRDTDVKAGKRTLAVRLGPRGARGEYFALLAIAYAVPVVLWILRLASPWVFLSWLSLPLAISPARRMARESGRALNAALMETARLQTIYGVLFAAGLLQGVA